MIASKPTLVIIAGPTAVGKTNVAIQLAKHFSTEILSVDSRQCYIEIPMGTAAPTLEEQQGIPHHFIGSHSIKDEMNAGQYEVYALDILTKLFKHHQVIIACGGTGLYIDAICNGIDQMPSTDKEIEQQLQLGYQENGIEWLQQICQMEDPEFWAIAEQQNPVRLIRALAFKRTNKTSIVKYRTQSKKDRPFNIIKIALELPRPILYDRINKRVDMMLEHGLLEEVASLFPYRGLKNLSTVGYSEFYEFNHWPLTTTELDFAIDKVKQHSRNYAKRQLTWFRKDPAYQWFAPHQTEEIIQSITSKL